MSTCEGKNLFLPRRGGLTRTVTKLRKGATAKIFLSLILTGLLLLTLAPTAFAVQGQASGIFVNPQPAESYDPEDMWVEGEGENTLLFGRPYSNTNPSSLHFEDAEFDTTFNQPFVLTQFEYHNNTTGTGTSPGSVDLLIDLGFTDPEETNHEFTYTLTLISTRNYPDQSPEENADSVVFPLDIPPDETYMLDGVEYTLRLMALEEVSEGGFIDPENPNQLSAYEAGEIDPETGTEYEGTVTVTLVAMLYADVYRYEFTCQYDSSDPATGDYYTGYSYDYHSYEVGDEVLAFEDENGDEGHYKITAKSEDPVDSSLAGQVFVDSYFDAESAEFYVIDDSAPVSMDFLGSEDAYIIMDDVPEYRFGASYYEADLVSYAYAFTFTFGNGDYYSGTVYAEPEYGYSTVYTQTITDENGQTGTYAIATVNAGYEVSLAGQVVADTYFDAESGELQAIATSNPVGTAYLGSEDAYIRMNGVEEYRFGLGFYEADLVSYAYAFTFTYGNGDYYNGTVYAAPEHGYAPGYTETTTDENGQTGTYAIATVTAGYEVSLAGQVVADTYFDAESGELQAIATSNPVGTAYLGSEDAYIRMSGVEEYRFGLGFYEADLVSYTYAFTFTYGNGDYYRGSVYAAPEHGYAQGYTETATDENGRTGTYAITGTASGDNGVDGQVFVDSYYDRESRFTYTPVHAGSAVGDGYLGTERDYILFDGMVLNRFGIGPEGSEEVHYEADVTWAQAWANRMWEPVRTFQLNNLYRSYYFTYRLWGRPEFDY